MAVVRITGNQWECDGCEVTSFVPDKTDGTQDKSLPEGWLRGSVDAGMVGGDWVAHKATCINKAVAKVLAADDGPPTDVDRAAGTVQSGGDA